jgi:SAM-dependent methyltransferase
MSRLWRNPCIFAVSELTHGFPLPVTEHLLKTQSLMLYSALNSTVLEKVPKTARRILDFGCGTGMLGAAIKDQMACEIVGVTFSEGEAAEAAKRLDRVLVDNLDTFTAPPDLGTFDVVICSHILEHLRELQRLLGIARRLMTPGGSLIVALPNVLHWKQRLLLLRGHFKYTEGGIMDSTHVRFFDWDTARALVSDSGFELREATSEGNFPIPFVRRVLPKAIAASVDRMFTRAFPGLFGAQFLMVGKPKIA